MRTRKTFAKAGLLATATATATATMVPGHALHAMAGTPSVTTVQAEPAGPRTDSGRSADTGKKGRGTKGPGSSAYGLSLTGPIPIAPVPTVSSTSAEIRRSLLQENSTGLLSAKALDIGAAADRADARVGDLRIPAAGLTADAITARCVAGKGMSRLVNVRLGGEALTSEPRANTTLPVQIPGLGPGWVTLNKQERLPDGRLSVTGMEAAIPLGPLGRETLRAANAVCGPGGPSKPSKPAAPGKPSGSGGEAQPQAGAPAPRPSPVKGDLPVTG